MLNLGAVAFLNPWALAFLAALPVIWLLIRALPPRPRRIIFPPIRLLQNLRRGEPPPDRTPVWVLLLRLTLAALLCFAFAQPVINPTKPIDGEGPLVIVLDNGWQAAPNWAARREALEGYIAAAERDGKSLQILTTAAPEGDWPETDNPVPLLSPADARSVLSSYEPQPFSPDHALTAQRVEQAVGAASRIIWLGDGLRHSGSDELVDQLSRFNDVEVIVDDEVTHPIALLAPEFSGLDINITARRPSRAFTEQVSVAATTRDGRPLAEGVLSFQAGAETATTTLSLPARIRNQVARLELPEVPSAGAVYLMDGRAGRPLAGVVVQASERARPPLTSARFFLERAVEPFAALKSGDMDQLIDAGVSVLLAANIGTFSQGSEGRIGRWVRNGGVLIRFAGPNMENAEDSLLPVQLRLGNRSLGGALSWETPQRLKPFEADSPFLGLEVPEDVVVNRQLLASPAFDLPGKTWAMLEDGTPIVTAEPRGDGWVILFHTTANGDWSNLALSGLFVEMLKRILPLANVAGSADPTKLAIGKLRPVSTLNGLGELRPASGSIAAISRDGFVTTVASPLSPPGYYGPEDAPLALNLASDNGPITTDFKFAALEYPFPTATYTKQGGGELPLKPFLLLLALFLILADVVAAQWLKGSLSRLRLRPVVSIILVGLALFSANHASAQNSQDAFIEEAARETRLGFVPTGNPATDRIIEAGLTGLQQIVRQRTSVQMGAPMAVNPEQELLFVFPLIYWPVPASATVLSDAATRNLGRYLASGGMVLFDTGIASQGTSTNDRAQMSAALNRILKGVQVPPLVQVTRDHVLTKSYYLLDRFPGRVSSQPVWAEAASSGADAIVSGILIGSGDWASAWALGQDGKPLVTLDGGEWQREQAFRFGINVVMYALTGTYKNDQVHLPILMRRLGE